MGPSSYRRSTRRSTTISQKQQPLKKKEEISTISPCKTSTTTNNNNYPVIFHKVRFGESNSPCKTSLKNNSTMIDGSNSSNEYCCSTPKAKRYKIKEIKTCPPAPKKKRRIVSSKSCNTTTSLKRTPISLFTPPDSELFLLFAFRDIPI